MAHTNMQIGIRNLKCSSIESSIDACVSNTGKLLVNLLRVFVISTCEIVGLGWWTTSVLVPEACLERNWDSRM